MPEGLSTGEVRQNHLAPRSGTKTTTHWLRGGYQVSEITRVARRRNAYQFWRRMLIRFPSESSISCFS